MLAAQFLNVVLEENDRSETGCVEDEEESNNNILCDIISQLDIKSQLANILLSECTIEPYKVAQKREKPVLSFEANVTPIFEAPAKKSKPNDDLLMNAVEAVYSDGEEDGDDSPTVPCPVCNRSFARNCSLALHLKSHEPLEENIKRYQCQLCPRSYSQKSVLKKHLAECSAPHNNLHQATDDNRERRFQCQFCHRSYSQKSVLKKHLVVHTGERERCNICGAGFSQRSSLVRHAKRIHGGLINHAVSGSNPNNNSSHSTSSLHNTPILTTALSGVTHPTLGTPLIVGIPLNQLASGKFANSSLARNLFIKSPMQLNSLTQQRPVTLASLMSAPVNVLSQPSSSESTPITASSSAA